MMSHKTESKKCTFDRAALFSVNINSGEMVIVTVSSLQSLSFIQRHLFFVCDLLKTFRDSVQAFSCL